MRRRVAGRTLVGGGIALPIFSSLGMASSQAWSPHGHCLVALGAADRLTPTASECSMAARWFDPVGRCGMGGSAGRGQQPNGPWHYVNLPIDATGYDRDRDCPLQPAITSGSRSDGGGIAWWTESSTISGEQFTLGRLSRLVGRLTVGVLTRPNRPTNGIFVSAAESVAAQRMPGVRSRRIASRNESGREGDDRHDRDHRR
jgi:hypothetical protein